MFGGNCFDSSAPATGSPQQEAAQRGFTAVPASQVCVCVIVSILNRSSCRSSGIWRISAEIWYRLASAHSDPDDERAFCGRKCVCEHIEAESCSAADEEASGRGCSDSAGLGFGVT